MRTSSRWVLRGACLGLFAISTIHCDKGKVTDKPEKLGQQDLRIQPAENYVPVPPEDPELFWGEAPPWQSLLGGDSDKRKQLLEYFPNTRATLSTRQLYAEGNGDFTAVKVAARGESHEISIDFAQYRVERSKDHCRVYTGVGVRLRITVKVFKGEVNLSNVPFVAASAEAGKLSGSIAFDTVGIHGELVAATVPFPQDLRPETVGLAAEVAKVLVSHLYDDNMQVTPQVFAVQCDQPGGVKASKHETEPLADKMESQPRAPEAAGAEGDTGGEAEAGTTGTTTG